MVMTQQYLVGELSLLLAQLQTAAGDPAFAHAATGLRRKAESCPLAVLPSIIVRALELTNDLCWSSLARGDTAAFARQAELSAELREFGVCSSMLDDAPR
jgi:hypothetical protein